MALVKSQCCLHGDVSLLETTELLTKLPPADLLNVMSCKVSFFHSSFVEFVVADMFCINKIAFP